jgi:hypothetical protein
LNRNNYPLINARLARKNSKHRRSGMQGYQTRKTSLQRRKKFGMTSTRRIEANRANAKASTGPRTTRGKARAAQNALRHGLSLPIPEGQALSDEAENLAREFAGEGATVRRGMIF